MVDNYTYGKSRFIYFFVMVLQHIDSHMKCQIENPTEHPPVGRRFSHFFLRKNRDSPPTDYHRPLRTWQLPPGKRLQTTIEKITMLLMEKLTNCRLGHGFNSKL